MEPEQQRRIVEAVILASPEPIAAQRIASLIPYCNPTQVRALVKELNEEYREQRRAFEIWEIAGGYQMRSLAEFSPYLKQIQKTRPLRLSPASLETLSVVAYRQPVTRAEIEQIRGVDAGAVLRGLLDRKLLRIAGHREVAGRPIVYATSRRFLEVFGLVRLGDLPSLRDLEDLAPGLEIDGKPIELPPAVATDNEEETEREGEGDLEVGAEDSVDAGEAPDEPTAPKAEAAVAEAAPLPPPSSATP